MNTLTTMFDFRIVSAVLSFIAVLLLLALMRLAAISYQSAFVRTVTAGLKQNFIIAEPRTLLIVNVVLTVVLGTAAYSLVGPVGAVAAAILAVAGSWVAVAVLVQRRSKRFLRAEKLANQAPVKMLFPLIALLFPITFIIIGFPIVMQLIHSGAFQIF